LAWALILVAAPGFVAPTGRTKVSRAQKGVDNYL
jgi:hypothetical protein